MWRILSFSLVIACAFAAPGVKNAWAMNCPAPEQPQITLDVVEDPVQYDFSRDRTALNQMGSTMLASRNTIGSSSYVGGLTNGTINSDMSTELQTLTSSDGSACVWVSSVKLRLHYQPVVYISREFVEGSCYHTAVLEHEHKHVAVDLALMQSFAPQLQQAIQAAAEQIHYGPFPAAQLESTGQNINQVMDAKLNESMSNLSAQRQAQQAQVDVPQEYARVQALCRNWP
jgi:hypothetical protein